jgi:GTPase
MNHLVGQKLSITSRKPQTTQHKINGVLTIENHQYIFVDTPGFQTRYINKFNTLLNQSVINTLKGVDVIFFVVEAGIFNNADLEVLQLLPPNIAVILVINKQDSLKDKLLLHKFLTEIKAKHNFADAITVSAKHNLHTDTLLLSAQKHLPPSEFLYPIDQLTDKSSNFLASEIVREKLFRYLGQELPYSVAVSIEEFIESPELIRISALIIVDKANQKGIVIGRGGERLKQISSEARLDMERLFGTKVFLQIWVKIKSGFADDAKFLKQFE